MQECPYCHHLLDSYSVGSYIFKEFHVTSDSCPTCHKLISFIVSPDCSEEEKIEISQALNS